ncbi:MAG TPA: hypothetical protein VHY08_21795, partial [Bacillota bacterium]|nr:hypothetical protein [Bacillota bacterium]
LLGALPTDLIANYPGTYTGPPGNGNTPDKTRTASFDPVKGWTWVDGVPDMPISGQILTLYNSTQHDCWAQTFNDPRMWDWLLAQKRTTVVQNEPLPDSAVYLGQSLPEERKDK